MRRLAGLLLLLLAAGVAGASEYLLGPGDVLKIGVYQNPDLATEARVSESGTITFPLIGTIRVAGDSAAAVERTIAARLRDGNFVKQPQVNALVLQFRGMQVSVLGQVNRPGKFPLEQSQNRLTEVLALAGGVTALGADVVTVITKDGDGEQRIEVDLPAIMQAGDRAKDIAVKNGDVVFVPRYPVYYIYGEVQRPGQYRLERGMTVMQALATGGGLTPLGTESGLRLTRKQPNGGVTTREAATSDLVQPDDVVFVRESFF